jgi:H+/gluconate symporter-like permease
MTTAAMVVAMVPLLIAGGAGAAARFNIGLVIAAGMIIGTIFTLFVTPAVYTYVAQDHKAARAREETGEGGPVAETPSGGVAEEAVPVTAAAAAPMAEAPKAEEASLASLLTARAEREGRPSAEVLAFTSAAEALAEEAQALAEDKDVSRKSGRRSSRRKSIPPAAE